MEEHNATKIKEAVQEHNDMTAIGIQNLYRGKRKNLRTKEIIMNLEGYTSGIVKAYYLDSVNDIESITKAKFEYKSKVEYYNRKWFKTHFDKVHLAYAKGYLEGIERYETLRGYYPKEGETKKCLN